MGLTWVLFGFRKIISGNREYVANSYLNRILPEFVEYFDFISRTIAVNCIITSRSVNSTIQNKWATKCQYVLHELFIIAMLKVLQYMYVYKGSPNEIRIGSNMATECMPCFWMCELMSNVPIIMWCEDTKHNSKIKRERETWSNKKPQRVGIQLL